MAKKPSRTPEQEENRNELANDLRKLRQYWDAWKELAKTMLEERKQHTRYKESQAKYIKEKEKAMEEKLKSEEKEKEEKNQYIQKEIEEIIQEEWYSSDGEGYFWTLIERCKDWTLNKDTAKKLIDAWYIKVLSYLLKKFEKLDNEIADIILNSEYWYHVVGNLEVFEWVDHNQLALKFIKERWDYNRALSANLGKFKGLTKETAKAWLDSNYYTVNIPYNLDSFVWLDKEILLKLKENESRSHMSDDKISESLKHFSWLDKETAMKLLDNNRRYSRVAKNIDQFEWLDEEVAKKLVEKWYWNVVAKYPEKFWLKKEK